ncbi:MAG: hypothetical protein M1821_007212 [Bathelium mastoideum]|nr:MAG: hypothetical protein M1821_007212 [Bathelium mastoideum]
MAKLKPHYSSTRRPLHRRFPSKDNVREYSDKTGVKGRVSKRRPLGKRGRQTTSRKQGNKAFQRMIDAVDQNERGEYSDRNYDAVQPHVGYLTRSLATATSVVDAGLSKTTASDHPQLIPPLPLPSHSNDGGTDMPIDSEEGTNQTTALCKPAAIDSVGGFPAYQNFSTSNNSSNSHQQNDEGSNEAFISYFKNMDINVGTVDTLMADDEPWIFDDISLALEEASWETDSISEAKMIAGPSTMEEVDWYISSSEETIRPNLKQHSSEARCEEHKVMASIRDDGTSPLDQSRTRFELHQDYNEIFANINENRRFRIRDACTIDSLGPIYVGHPGGEVESRRSLHLFRTDLDGDEQDEAEIIVRDCFILVEARRPPRGKISFMSEQVQCRVEETPIFSDSAACLEWFQRMFDESATFHAGGELRYEYGELSASQRFRDLLEPGSPGIEGSGPQCPNCKTSVWPTGCACRVCGLCD